MDEVVAQLVIALRADGSVHIGGKVANKIQALGLLELAKAQIAAGPEPAPQGPSLLIARGSLPNGSRG